MPSVAANEQCSAVENLFDCAEYLLHPLVPRPLSLVRRASESVHKQEASVVFADPLHDIVSSC